MTGKGKDRLLVILGPTAVGKTALSLSLAEELRTEIISGDSMLVYRGFDIGSAKPGLEERRGIPHHLIDIREPGGSYNVTDFVTEAGAVIRRLNDRGKIPILAGGTGLYVKALLEGYEFSRTEGHEAYRARLEELGRTRGRAYVHGLLAKADPETAARLHENNFRRVVRALEVLHFGGEQISRSRRLDGTQELCYDALVLGLERDRQKLYERINGRAEQMLASGLLEEVQKLLDSGLGRETQAMQGIGYKEAAACLAGEMTREEAKEEIQKATRHFAKRQLTWYRKMPYIKWLRADGKTEAELLSEAVGLVEGHWGLS